MNYQTAKIPSRENTTRCPQGNDSASSTGKGEAGNTRLPLGMISPESSSAGQILPTLKEIECDHIRRVLRHVDDNRTKAAEILGIDRVSLWRKIKRLGLSP